MRTGGEGMAMDEEKSSRLAVFPLFCSGLSSALLSLSGGGRRLD